MRNINLIVIHCSDTSAWVELTPQALDKMHRQRGVKATGYHFYSCRSGDVVPCLPRARMGSRAEVCNAKRIAFGTEVM